MVIDLEGIMKMMGSRQGCAEGQRTRKARGRPGEGEGGGDKAGQMPRTGSVPDIAFPIGEEGRVFKDQTPSFHLWSRWHLGGF